MVQVVDYQAWSEMLPRDLGCQNVPLAGGKRDAENQTRVDDVDCFTRSFGVSTQAAEDGSDEFSKVRQAILRQCTAAMIWKLQKRAPFPIDVNLKPLQTNSSEITIAYLEKVRDLVRALSRRAIAYKSNTSGASRRYVGGNINVDCEFPFDPRYMQLDLTLRISNSSGVSGLLTEIAASGVRLTIDLNEVEIFRQLSPTVLGPVVLAMTQHSTWSEGTQAVARLSTCENTIRCGYSPYLMKFFSSGTRNEKWRRWQWLAFALFSNESSSSVSRLIIEGYEFLRENMAAINSILEAKNPAMKLLSKRTEGPYYEQYGEDDAGELIDNMATEELGDGGSICLPAGTSVKIDPGDFSFTGPTFLKLKTDSTFRMTRKDNSDRKVVGYLISGSGHCVADRASITELVNTPQESSVSQGYRGQLRVLEFVPQYPTYGDARYL